MSNISIRVKLPEAPEEYQVKEERIILWDRVLSAAFMVIIALAVVYFVAVYGFEKSPSQAIDNAATTAAAPIANTTTAQATRETPTARPDIETTTAAQNAVKATSAITATEQAALEEAPVKEMATADKKAAAMPVATPVIKDPTASAEQAAVTALPTAPDNSTVQEPTKPQALTPAAVVEIISPKVKRAIITREMNNRKPGAALADTVMVQEGELLTVYFYTEFDGLKKQTLHYDWYQNGKRRARVRIRPLEENIGNYSSKYITHRMTGQWTVSVSTAAGEKLARAKFEVVGEGE